MPETAAVPPVVDAPAPRKRLTEAKVDRLRIRIADVAACALPFDLRNRLDQVWDELNKAENEGWVTLR